MPIKSEMDIKLSSEEIMTIMDKKPGQWLGLLKREMNELVLLGKLKNEKKILTDYVKGKMVK
jgi:tRNA nucleotidyltransferase (CCA-adding enzyme)